jgi:hypothetical protein
VWELTACQCMAVNIYGCLCAVYISTQPCKHVKLACHSIRLQNVWQCMAVNIYGCLCAVYISTQPCKHVKLACHSIRLQNVWHLPWHTLCTRTLLMQHHATHCDACCAWFCILNRGPCNIRVLIARTLLTIPAQRPSLPFLGIQVMQTILMAAATASRPL